MKEFSNMQSLHSEISQIADQAGAREVVVRLEGIDDDSSLEGLGDRDLAKIERRILNYAARVHEERERRHGLTSGREPEEAAKEEPIGPTSAQQFVSVNDCWQGSTMRLDRFNSRPREQDPTMTKTLVFNAPLSPDEEGLTLRHPRQLSGEFYNPTVSPAKQVGVAEGS